MVRATTRTAPILMPEDVKQAYVYGLDAESIRKEFLTHLWRQGQPRLRAECRTPPGHRAEP